MIKEGLTYSIGDIPQANEQLSIAKKNAEQRVQSPSFVESILQESETVLFEFDAVRAQTPERPKRPNPWKGVTGGGVHTVSYSSDGDGGTPGKNNRASTSQLKGHRGGGSSKTFV